ncbi:DUF3427 domain-containing protein [Periweissella ghanensis]|uniref:DUF3427 domain-containing protein n=1 Tax=Periweissella ghanensis TaxID=467997 RepID=A0ABM8Z9G3_9LACO|nr:DUF3427 domain-containing protein [Periweissella ghanensis]MCM0601147.1 DUF3427 domain-containing protein [Periweissella ghanensis]CAH0417943.1 hypothetical protein WGH24286_00359 [Periweissella ghanensis]
MLLTHDAVTDEQLIAAFEQHGYFYDEETLGSIEDLLSLKYVGMAVSTRPNSWSFVNRIGKQWQLGAKVATMLAHAEEMATVLAEVRAAKDEILKDNDVSVRLELGKTYYASDIVQAFNWRRRPNFAGRKRDWETRYDDRYCVLLVNPATQASNYDDPFKPHFTSVDTLVWYGTRNSTFNEQKRVALDSMREFGKLQVFLKEPIPDENDRRMYQYLGSGKLVQDSTLHLENIETGEEGKIAKYVIKIDHTTVPNTLFPPIDITAAEARLEAVNAQMAALRKTTMQLMRD